MVSALPQPLLLRPFASAAEEENGTAEDESTTEEEDRFTLELETGSFTEEEYCTALELKICGTAEDEETSVAELETGGTTAELDSVTAAATDDDDVSPEQLCSGGMTVDALLCSAELVAMGTVVSAPFAELSDSQLMNAAAVAAARTVRILDFIWLSFFAILLVQNFCNALKIF